MTRNTLHFWTFSLGVWSASYEPVWLRQILHGVLNRSRPIIEHSSFWSKRSGFVEAEEGVRYVSNAACRGPRMPTGSYSALALRTHFYPQQWFLCHLCSNLVVYYFEFEIIWGAQNSTANNLCFFPPVAMAVVSHGPVKAQTTSSCHGSAQDLSTPHMQLILFITISFWGTQIKTICPLHPHIGFDFFFRFPLVK